MEHEFASIESRLVSDGHRIFAEFHRRLKSGGNVEQHVTTCSKLYMKSIESASINTENQDLATKLNHALTFWHLSHICMLSRDKSVVPELVQWLDENFLQSEQEEMMFEHLLRESSNAADQQVWYLCRHFLIRGRRDLASKILTKHPMYVDHTTTSHLWNKTHSYYTTQVRRDVRYSAAAILDSLF